MLLKLIHEQDKWYFKKEQAIICAFNLNREAKENR